MLLAIALAACGGSDEPVGPPKVDVKLSEWSVDADPTKVAAGDVTFTATNSGGIVHEMIVLKTDMAADALVVEGTKVSENDSGEVIGEIDQGELPAGGKASATYNLAAGNYVLFCNIATHYGQGMTTAFTVE
ncbi:MAG: plastocyanin/azurin family copper-binding protein [Chloroflexi bacterium]|nr:plastocyanin/azurin family copper-binding protein [Chloroflexota bacterium]